MATKALTKEELLARVSKVESYAKEHNVSLRTALTKTSTLTGAYYTAKKRLSGKLIKKVKKVKMKVHKVELASIPEIRDLNVMIQGDKVIVTLSRKQASDLFSKLF